MKKILPFTFKGWDSNDTYSFNYYDAVFPNDFGEILAGESFSSVEVDFMQGIIKAYDVSGQNIVKSTTFALIPVTE